MIWYFLMLQNDQHDRSHYHLLSYRQYIVFYYFLHTLHFILMIHFLCNWEFVPLHPPPPPTYFTHSSLTTAFPLAAVSLLSVSMPRLLFCLFTRCFRLNIWVISHDISFSVWLISLSITPLRSIHDIANGKISFLMTNISLCVYVSHIFSHLSVDTYVASILWGYYKFSLENKPLMTGALWWPRGVG